MPAQVRSGLYVQSPPALRRRDEQVRRLVRRMRSVMPWLVDSDIPACRAWAELELLAARAFMVLKQDGIVNRKREPHRLLRDYRQLRQAQLTFATALGMTPAARSMIKASRDSEALDVAAIAASLNDDGAVRDDQSDAAQPDAAEAEAAPAEEVPAE